MKSRKQTEILISFSFWISIGILVGLTSYLQMIQKGYSCGFFATLGEQVASLLPWGLYSLLILWLVRKYPLSPRQGRNPILFVHLPVAIAVAAFHCSLTGFIWWISSGINAGESLQDYFSYIFLGRIILHLIIYAGVLLACYAYTYYEQFQQKRFQVDQLERLLAEARLDALKTQLQPHFLFNTLNTISMLVRKKDEETAVRVVAKLAELLRYVLENREIHWVELRQEVRFVENYLAVESIRFQNRLTYTISVDPEAETILIPDLILQPIVENAIKHGISEKPEGGKIELFARNEPGFLELIVHDNGAGFNGTERHLSKNGIGLKNIRERLEALYNDEASFTISGRAEQGTTVLLRLPVK